MNYLANQYCRSYVQVLANHSSAYDLDLDPVLLKYPASPMTVYMCGVTITESCDLLCLIQSSSWMTRPTGAAAGVGSSSSFCFLVAAEPAASSLASLSVR